MPATSSGVEYPNAWARNGCSNSAAQGTSLCAMWSHVRACVGIGWLCDPPQAVSLGEWRASLMICLQKELSLTLAPCGTANHNNPEV